MSQSVIIVEDNADLCALMCEVIHKSLDVNCECFASLDEISSQPEVLNDAAVAFLDVNLGVNQPTGVEVYEWLKNAGFRGKIYFLTGHARNHPLIARAVASGVTTLEKPIPTCELLDIIKSNLSKN